MRRDGTIRKGEREEGYHGAGGKDGHPPPSCQLSALELSCGFPFDGHQASPRLCGEPGAARGDDSSPRAALAAAIAASAARAPLAVAFSGGRDSSLLLAVAASVCQQLGAEPPLAVTLQFERWRQEADERKWQELVLEHLRLRAWRRVAVGPELDLVGPYARRHLLRDGVLFPANAHTLAPVLEAASGRCLLVGLGGDELLGPAQWWHLQQLLGGRRVPEARDALRLAAAGLPRWVRARIRRRDGELEPLPWLRPEANRQLTRRLRVALEEPVRWGEAIRHLASRADVALPVRSLERLAERVGATVAAPLLEPGFVEALARSGGAAGWRTRAEAMSALAGDLLPGKLLARRDKARFNRVLFGAESRAFAARWRGGGVDARLVDSEALRRAWLAPFPDFRAALLLQAAWLHEHTQAEALAR